MYRFIFNFCLGLLTVQLGEVLRWFPEPETTSKAMVLAIFSGFAAAFGRWVFFRILLRNKKS